MPQQRRVATAAAAELELELGQEGPRLSRCCVPGECLRPEQVISLDELSDDLVKVVCNDDHCAQGQYMHQVCFDAWEQQVSRNIYFFDF
jgi:Headcase protein family homologue